jgi:hypothetical protein
MLDQVVCLNFRDPPRIVPRPRDRARAGIDELLERGDWSDSQMSEFMQDLSCEVLESGDE